MNLVTLGIRNLRRNLTRTVLTILGCMVAFLAFVALRTLLVAFDQGEKYAAQDRLVTRHRLTFVLEIPANYLETVRAVPGVKAASPHMMFGGRHDSNPNEFIHTLAVDAEALFQVLTEMELPPDQKAAFLADRQGAIIGEALAKRLGWKIGDRIPLRGTVVEGNFEFTIRGIYTSRSKSLDRNVFYCHYKYIMESVPPGHKQKDMMHFVLLKVDDPKNAAAVGTAIDKIFDIKDIQTATISERENSAALFGVIGSVLSAISVVSLAILGIMLLILGNTIAMGVRERTAEYGAMRAIGFSKGQIGTLIIAESMFTAIVGCGLGILLAYPLVTNGIGKVLELNAQLFFPNVEVTPQILVVCGGLALALGVLAAALPARSAMSLQITEALRRLD